MATSGAQGQPNPNKGGGFFRRTFRNPMVAPIQGGRDLIFKTWLPKQKEARGTAIAGAVLGAIGAGIAIALTFPISAGIIAAIAAGGLVGGAIAAVVANVAVRAVVKTIGAVLGAVAGVVNTAVQAAFNIVTAPFVLLGKLLSLPFKKNKGKEAEADQKLSQPDQAPDQQSQTPAKPGKEEEKAASEPVFSSNKRFEEVESAFRAHGAHKIIKAEDGSLKCTTEDLNFKHPGPPVSITVRPGPDNTTKFTADLSNKTPEQKLEAIKEMCRAVWEKPPGNGNTLKPVGEGPDRAIYEEALRQVRAEKLVVSAPGLAAGSQPNQGPAAQPNQPPAPGSQPIASISTGSPLGPAMTVTRGPTANNINSHLANRLDRMAASMDQQTQARTQMLFGVTPTNLPGPPYSAITPLADRNRTGAPTLRASAAPAPGVTVRQPQQPEVTPGVTPTYRR